MVWELALVVEMQQVTLVDVWVRLDTMRMSNKSLSNRSMSNNKCVVLNVTGMVEVEAVAVVMEVDQLLGRGCMMMYLNQLQLAMGEVVVEEEVVAEVLSHRKLQLVLLLPMPQLVLRMLASLVRTIEVAVEAEVEVSIHMLVDLHWFWEGI